MAFVRKALSFRSKGRYNVQEAKENRFPTRSYSSYKRMTFEGSSTANSEKQGQGNTQQQQHAQQVSEAVQLRRRQSDSNIKVAKVLRDTFGSIRQVPKYIGDTSTQDGRFGDGGDRD
jgi:hypothetical protein